jgi:hypothetical protein
VFAHSEVEHTLSIDEFFLHYLPRHVELSNILAVVNVEMTLAFRSVYRHHDDVVRVESQSLRLTPGLVLDMAIGCCMQACEEV